MNMTYGPVTIAVLTNDLINCSIKINIRIRKIGTDVDIKFTSATIACIISPKKKATTRIIDFDIVEVIESSVSSGCSEFLIQFKIFFCISIRKRNSIIL